MTEARARSAAVVTLAAWIAFCLAAAVVGRTTNDARFDVAAEEHRLIGAAHWLGTAALVSSLAVVVCAALPLIVVAARQARRRRDRGALALFAAPPAGLVVLVGYTALLGQLPDRPVHGAVNVAITLSWLALGVTVAGLAGVASAAALMRRTQLPPTLVRLMAFAVTATAGAMSFGLMAGMAYGVGVWVEVPDLFSSANGLLQTPLPLTWAALLLVAFAVATAVRAALSVVHVLSAGAMEV